MTASPSPAPSYCQLHVGAPLSPSQWTTCWNYGWHQPASLAARLGYDFGHNILPVLIIVAVLAFALIRFMSRS